MADTTRPRTRSSKASRSPAPQPASGAPLDPEWLAEVDGLSFQEARTALDLAMAQLQADDLEVEQMAGLHRRAEAYAKRCETVLQQVERQVIQWDADAPLPPA